MPGWMPTDADAWFREREAIEGRWPMVLVVTDLRFWDNAKCCSGRERPSVRELGRVWGWSVGAVSRVLHSPEKWADSSGSSWNAGGTARNTVGTPVEQSGTPDALPTSATDDTWNTSGTPAEHLRNTSGTALIETRARIPTPVPTPVPTEQVEPTSGPAVQASLLPLASPSADVVNKTRPIPDEVVAAHEAFKRTHIKSPQKITAQKGEGVFVASLVKQHGAEQVAALYQWAAVSDATEALLMRGHLPNRAGGHYKPRSAEWLTIAKGKHWDEMWEAMNAISLPTASSAASRPSAPPSSRWQAACIAANFQHPAWVELLKPEDRPMFIEVSKRVGGARALGQASNDFQTRDVLKAFDAAWEAVRGSA